MMQALSATIRNLKYSVPPETGSLVIADIPTLDLAPGAMTALAGPSGSGKSTLLYLLAGLLKPKQGSIVWGEIDLAREREAARDRWRLNHAGFVFQSFNLIEELSPLENVLLPARFSGGSAARLRERALALLTEFDVPTDRKRAASLSRGQQQRVAVARALLLDPPLIFADEPTASLDAQTGDTVAQALAQLARDQGRTVIVASHDPVVLDLADRVVRLDHGRIGQSETLAA